MHVGQFPHKVSNRLGKALVIATALLIAAGCAGSPVNLPLPVPFTAGGGLTKKVAILPFEMQSAYADPRSRGLFQQSLVDVLETECSGVDFMLPAGPDLPADLAEVPRLENGDLDNFQLAVTGRRWGLNAVVIGSLSSITVDDVEKGFWWFKKLRHYVQVEIRVDILDTETASKLLSHTVNRRVEIDPVDLEMINARKQVELFYFEEILDEIAEDGGETVCEALAEQPWKSYVLLVEGGELLIAAGEASNLQPGALLEVFDSSEVVGGVGAHRYVLPGPKVGEARVSVVDSRVSRATVTSGSNFSPGLVVRAK